MLRRRRDVQRSSHFGAPFLVYWVLMTTVGLAAVNSQNNLLFWILSVLVTALLLSGIVSGWMLSGLSVHRLDPGRGAVGEPLLLRYRLRNRNRMGPAFDVRIEDLPARGGATFRRFMTPASAWVMHIGPREAVHGEAVFWPLTRGEACFDCVRVMTAFPFGLLRKSFTISQPARTLIYPRLYHLRRGVLTSLVSGGPLGTHATSHSGPGDDFYGLREYRPGDSLRHVAWKRTANRDQVICVEHSQPSPPRLRLVLNLTRPTEALRRGGADAAAARQGEEDAISLAASIACAADEAGFEVGLTVLGCRLSPLPPRRGARHLGRLMSGLALIDLDQERLPPQRQPGEPVRVAVVAIHPGRVEPGVVSGAAWHLSSDQLPRLSAGPVGWDPQRNLSWIRGGRGSAEESATPARPSAPAPGEGQAA
jgi:uncharacterized protein (DUF58 family)